MRYLLLVLGLLIISIPAHAVMHGSSSIPYILDPTLNNTVVGGGLGAVTSGNQNICIGANTCTGITTAVQNTIILNNESILTTGNFNFIAGYPSDVFSGSTTSAVGLGGGKVGSFDIAIGVGALQNTAADGNGNVGIGFGVLNNITTGLSNTAVGYGAAAKQSGGASSNVILGANAGTGAGPASTYSNVTIVGAGVGPSTKSGTNNILLGVSSAIDVSGTSASNEIHIGGTGGDWAKVTGSNANSTEVYTLNGEFASAGGLPTCGTGCASVTAGSTNVRGAFVSGSSVSAVTINWSHTLPSAPFCVISDSNTSAVADISTVSTTVLTISLASALTSVTIYYHCIQ